MQNEARVPQERGLFVFCGGEQGMAVTGASYRREIDGLRAIAVLGVVLFHAGVPGLSGGFAGVDVFFVISGYLITLLLLREWRERGAIDLPGFYARRIRRLLPALWLLIAVTLVAAMALLPAGPPMQGMLDSAIASLLFVANFHFAANSGGYFDGPSEEMPLLHLWSLSVEEQYYFVVPLAMILVLRRWPRTWRAWLAIASVASFLFAELALRSTPSTAFYQMPARFWELGVGGLIAGCAPGRLGARWPARLFAAGVVLTLAAMCATGPGHFPGAGALPAVIGAALILHALNDSERLGVCGRLLASRPMVAIGLISYSLYLWHWPLLAFDRATAVSPSSLSYRLGLCAVAMVLAWGSYRFVETPFRRSTLRWPRFGVLAGGAVVSLMLMGAAWGLKPAQDGPPSPAETLAWTTRLDHPANMDRCHVSLADEVVQLPGTDCRSDPARSPDVVIWGDSHALAWQPLAWEIARSQGGSAIGFTLDSCPPVTDYARFRADFPQHEAHCRRFNALVMDYISSHRVKTLIMSGRWPAYFPSFDDEGTTRGKTAPGGDEAMATGLAKALADVAWRVDRVLLVAAPPQLRDAAPKCIAAGQLAACATPRVEYDRMTARSRRLLVDMAARHPNVTVIDPADFFCDSLECPVLKDGRGLFWDDDHVATSAATAFAREYLRAPERWAKARR
ncbi:MAG TPA: acyltransferase family protein [Lysobacter sp.]